MIQEEYNKMTERTSQLALITYERQEQLIEWLQEFVHAYGENMQFILETILKTGADVIAIEGGRNPLRRLAYTHKRIDELEETLKGFIGHYYEEKEKAPPKKPVPLKKYD